MSAGEGTAVALPRAARRALAHGAASRSVAPWAGIAERRTLAQKFAGRTCRCGAAATHLVIFEGRKQRSREDRLCDSCTDRAREVHTALSLYRCGTGLIVVALEVVSGG